MSTGIIIKFDECDILTEKNCLSKASKRKFFTQTEGNFFFVTIQNSETFNTTEYNDDKKVIISESGI